MSEGIDRNGLIRALREQSLDPGTCTSCAPASGREKIPGVAGCSQYKRCIFGQPRYGGFKGEPGGYRQHYVIYEYKPNDGTNHQKEDIIGCRIFMQTHYDRMVSGKQHLEQGLPGEIINIIGTEGDDYLYGWFGRDKERPNDPLAEFKENVEVRTCPKYKEAVETGGEGYAAQVARRRAERAKEDAEVEQRPLPKRKLNKDGSPASPVAPEKSEGVAAAPAKAKAGT